MGKIKIIGGQYRSRVIKFDDHVDSLRPTPNKLRETLFNWLGQDLTGKNCLDAFSGSGALGFEAMSRNAKCVVMLDNNFKAVKSLKANWQLLRSDSGSTHHIPFEEGDLGKISNEVVILNQSALNYFMQSSNTFDIIFLDPPYAGTLLNQTLQLILKQQHLGDCNLSENQSPKCPLLKDGGVIYIEFNKYNAPDLSGYEMLRESKSGDAKGLLVRLEGR